MAKFKVGDRVRVIGSLNPDLKCFIGKETVITAASFVYEDSWVVDLSFGDGRLVSFHESRLAPLTDPNAEWAAEKVRQLIKIPAAV